MKRAWTVIGLAALLVCGSAVYAGDESAEAVLKAKGLTKVGLLYLLDGDVNLRAGLRVMRQAGSQLDSSLAKRGELERQLRGAREAQLQLYVEDQELHARMEKAKDIPLRYNDLVAQVNQVEARIHQADAYIADREKALKSFSIPSEQYASAVNDLYGHMEATAKQYEALAADPEVVAALATINTGARFPVKLGPSAQFTTELASVRRDHEKVRAAGIKFELEGGVPVVHVILNGTLPWKMVLDSGASEVTLTFAVAQQLGLTPEASDPVMRMRSADGKITVARLKMLKSVQLGQFTVENVECVVLPEGVPGANLLGATFLSRFVYQMDLNAGEVRLSQIGPTIKPTANETAVSSKRQSTDIDKPGETAPASGLDKDKGTNRDKGPLFDSGPLDDDKNHKMAAAPPEGVAEKRYSVGGDRINLLSLIDAKRDAISGAWHLGSEGLSCDTKTKARLAIPYRPPAEYDYHIEFTAESGSGVEAMLMYHAQHAFQFTMESGPHGCFFSRITNAHGEDNNQPLQANRVRCAIGTRHSLTVEVRDKSITAYLDKKLVTSYKTDFSNLSAGAGFDLPGGLLGLGTYQTATTFNVVELVSVSGQGSPVDRTELGR